MHNRFAEIEIRSVFAWLHHKDLTNKPISLPVSRLVSIRRTTGIHSIFQLPPICFIRPPFLTPKYLNQISKQLLHDIHNSSRYSSHGFRIGAATAAAGKNTPNTVIQRNGHWRSQCFTKYVRSAVPSIQWTHADVIAASWSCGEWNFFGRGILFGVTLVILVFSASVTSSVYNLVWPSFLIGFSFTSGK